MLQVAGNLSSAISQNESYNRLAVSMRQRREVAGWALKMKGLAVGWRSFRVAGWERYGWLRHGFSTRMGGVSTVYGGNSLNLGWTKEDDPALVAENRRRFLLAVCGQDAGVSLVGVRQIHSGVVRVVRRGMGRWRGGCRRRRVRRCWRGMG